MRIQLFLVKQPFISVSALSHNGPLAPLEPTHLTSYIRWKETLRFCATRVRDMPSTHQMGPDRSPLGATSARSPLAPINFGRSCAVR